jgi:predicted nucleic acid-binding protein
MGQLIDTCVWIDHLRKGTPDRTRQVADAALNDPDAVLCEPVRFELLAGAGKRDRPLLLERLATMPQLSTPPGLWPSATSLAANLCDAGVRIPPMDLLISAICIHHKVTLVTFDAHFQDVARLSKLQVEILLRPDR